MKNSLVIILTLFSMASIARGDVNNCPKLNLNIPESKANPVIKVAPLRPLGTNRNLPVCVVVSFRLVEKTTSEGGGLVPGEIKIEGSSDKAWDTPVKVAVSRWLYLSEGIDYRGRQYVIYKIPSQSP
ncbi:hypothetical protein ACJJIR_16525 [Microbulbifer sp. SSSA008]|uniref:hypothetical protein n=1 Tax=Microbulbifer sp. SSSA008 TaxID=3243380 RepID=UPI004039B122